MRLYDVQYAKNSPLLCLIRLDLIILCVSWLMHNFAELTTKVAAGIDEHERYVFVAVTP